MTDKAATPRTDGFKPIRGFENYIINRDGIIANTILRNKQVARYREIPKILKPTPNSHGYLTVTLCDGNGNAFSKKVHVLVLLAFVGECPVGMEASHKNGNRQDCRLSNLLWETPKANTARKELHGTQLRGERTHNAVLTDEQVINILYRISMKHKQRDIASDYGVDERIISKIKRGSSWNHLPR